MTTFKEIRGQLIRTLDTDPTPATTYEGQIWYNKTIGVLKSAELFAATWSAGGNLSTSRGKNMGAGGSQSSAITMGGAGAPGSGGLSATEEYNGSSWSGGGNLNQSRYGGQGTGTETAGLCNGGYSATTGYTGHTEEYDGSTWTTVTSSPRTTNEATAFGIQTAAVVAGGYAPPSWRTDALNYDGTNWTTSGSFSNPLSGAQGPGSAGTQTAGLVFGGFIPPTASGAGTMEYDGTSFTNGNNMNVPAYRSGAGTQTAAIGFSSATPVNPVGIYTELYDGTSWTSSTNFTVGRTDANQNTAPNTPNSSALIFGGRPEPSTASTSTEEFTGAFVGTKTLTTS